MTYELSEYEKELREDYTRSYRIKLESTHPDTQNAIWSHIEKAMKNFRPFWQHLEEHTLVDTVNACFDIFIDENGDIIAIDPFIKERYIII